MIQALKYLSMVCLFLACHICLLPDPLLGSPLPWSGMTFDTAFQVPTSVQASDELLHYNAGSMWYFWDGSSSRMLLYDMSSRKTSLFTLPRTVVQRLKKQTRDTRVAVNAFAVSPRRPEDLAPKEKHKWMLAISIDSVLDVYGMPLGELIGTTVNRAKPYSIHGTLFRADRVTLNTLRYSSDGTQIWGLASGCSSPINAPHIAINHALLCYQIRGTALTLIREINLPLPNLPGLLNFTPKRPADWNESFIASVDFDRYRVHILDTNGKKVQTLQRESQFYNVPSDSLIDVIEDYRTSQGVDYVQYVLNLHRPIQYKHSRIDGVRFLSDTSLAVRWKSNQYFTFGPSSDDRRSMVDTWILKSGSWVLRDSNVTIARDDSTALLADLYCESPGLNLIDITFCTSFRGPNFATLNLPLSEAYRVYEEQRENMPKWPRWILVYRWR